MNSTRRLFLQKAALSAFCQKLLNSQTKGFEPETLVIFNGVSRQTFEPWIGSRFSVSQNNKSQGSLVLMSVDEIDTTGKDASDSTNTVRRVRAVPRPSKASAITSFSLRSRGQELLCRRTHICWRTTGWGPFRSSSFRRFWRDRRRPAWTCLQCSTKSV